MAMYSDELLKRLGAGDAKAPFPPPAAKEQRS